MAGPATLPWSRPVHARWGWPNGRVGHHGGTPHASHRLPGTHPDPIRHRPPESVNAVWVDDDRTAHTVAPPDWRQVIRIAGTVTGGVSGDLIAVVEVERDIIYSAIAAGELGPGGVVGGLPPTAVAVPVSVFTHPPYLADFLRTLDPWWRLDVLDAIEDCAAGWPVDSTAARFAAGA